MQGFTDLSKWVENHGAINNAQVKYTSYHRIENGEDKGKWIFEIILGFLASPSPLDPNIVIITPASVNIKLQDELACQEMRSMICGI